MSSEGRFMRRSEVGQSESWPEGQPEGRCGAWGRASQARNREAMGFRPARNWVCHCELAGRGQASGEKTPCSRTSTGVCQVPGRTDQGLKTPRREAERRRRVPLFLGNPGNKPRPLPRCAFRRPVSPQCRGGKLTAQLARRRENASARLLEPEVEVDDAGLLA